MGHLTHGEGVIDYPGRERAYAALVGEEWAGRMSTKQESLVK